MHFLLPFLSSPLLLFPSSVLLTYSPSLLPSLSFPLYSFPSFFPLSLVNPLSLSSLLSFLPFPSFLVNPLSPSLPFPSFFSFVFWYSVQCWSSGSCQTPLTSSLSYFIISVIFFLILQSFQHLYSWDTSFIYCIMIFTPQPLLFYFLWQCFSSQRQYFVTLLAFVLLGPFHCSLPSLPLVLSSIYITLMNCVWWL